MKSEIFNQYVEKVTELFDMRDEQLFNKTKKGEIVQARQLLYYLCYVRPMRVKDIEKYMAERGYTIGHSVVIHGIDRVRRKMEEDEDYVRVIKNIEQSVYI
jgi:chromosomal replication initiation ATPase DnaA